MSIFYDEEYEKIKNGGFGFFKKIKNKINEDYRDIMEMHILNSMIHLSDRGMMYYPIRMGKYQETYIKVNKSGWDGFRIRYINVKKQYSENNYGTSDVRAKENEVYVFDLYEGSELYQKVKEDSIRINIVLADENIENFKKSIKKKFEKIEHLQNEITEFKETRKRIMNTRGERKENYGVVVQKSEEEEYIERRIKQYHSEAKRKEEEIKKTINAIKSLEKEIENKKEEKELLKIKLEKAVNESDY